MCRAVAEIFKSNEYSEDSYIGLADFFLFFFQEKVLKFVHAHFLTFRGLTCDFFKVQRISIIKRKANFFIEQQNCIGHEKRDRLLILKMEINYLISQRNESFTYLPSFLILC